MTFRASLPVKRRTMSGYVDQTIYGYGASPIEAFSDVFALLAVTNRGQNPRCPTLIRNGKPTVRKERAEDWHE